MSSISRDGGGANFSGNCGNSEQTPRALFASTKMARQFKPTKPNQFSQTSSAGGTKMIADRIKTFKRVKVTDLIDNPRNWRKHPDAQRNALGGLLDSVGWADAVLARETDEGLMLIDGHLRKELAADSKVPVLVLDVTEAEADLILATHDPLTSMAETDQALLDELVQGLDIENDETQKMLDELASDPVIEAEEDELPEPPADPITKTGDLWKLGDHRLLCGDATSADDVARLMDGAKADIWLCDPPYNVDYTGKTKEALKIENDGMEDLRFRSFLVTAFDLALSNTKAGGAFYIWHADSEGYNFRGAIFDCGETVRQCLIWVKQTMVMGRQDYQWKHEPCLYGWKSGAAHSWHTDRKQTTVLEFDRPSRSVEHPTMKPVELFAYLLSNSSSKNDVVLDPFLGSGTTMIAAEQLGRKCYGMELSPAYCDVIIKRWENVTGNKARKV